LIGIRMQLLLTYIVDWNSYAAAADEGRARATLNYYSAISTELYYIN